MSRILIFSLAYYPRFVGGAEVAIKEITDRVASSELEFDMITAKLARGQSSFERIGTVNIYRIGVGSSADKVLFPILGTLKALQLLRKRTYDAFWPMMVSYSSGVPYLINILRNMIGKPHIPVVLTLQEGDSEEHIRGKSFGLAGAVWRMVLTPVIIFLPKQFRKLGLIGISWALALKRTDAVTVISKYLADQARAFGYTGPLTLVANGVDIKRFASRDASRIAALAETLGKKTGDVFLITTSRLVVKNAVKDIIDALTYLPAQVKLLILGTGPLEMELKQHVADLKLDSRVLFLGFISQTDLPAYLHVSDIFVRPSLSEGLGISFLEAMAAGLPVIATQVGGIPDFLVDGETGLFCEVSNPRSIAQKVEKLTKDAESRDYIVKNAQRLIAERYNWEELAPRMKEVFEKTIHGK